LYLVRHGESISNVERRHCATPPGPPLTERGRRQAERVAALLWEARPRPTVLLTSPLLRAQDTCRPLAVRLGVTPEVVPGLREIGAGAWEGALHSELAKRYGAAYTAWIHDPEGHPPPGGECLSEAGERMERALAAALAHHPGAAVAAFSHMDPMLGFHVRVTGGDFSTYPALPLGNAAVLTYRYEDTTGRWQFVHYDERAGNVPTAQDAAPA